MAPRAGRSRVQRAGRRHGRLVCFCDLQAEMIPGFGGGLFEGLVDLGAAEGGARVVADKLGWVRHSGDHFSDVTSVF